MGRRGSLRTKNTFRFGKRGGVPLLEPFPAPPHGVNGWKMPGVGGGCRFSAPAGCSPPVFAITWGSPINRHPLRQPPHGPGVAGAGAAVLPVRGARWRGEERPGGVKGAVGGSKVGGLQVGAAAEPPPRRRPRGCRAHNAGGQAAPVGTPSGNRHAHGEMGGRRKRGHLLGRIEAFPLDGR